MSLLEILACLMLTVVIWCAIHRARQIGTPGFKTWPVIGVTLEVAANYHRVYDWILEDFVVKNQMTTVASMPGTTFVFTADPANVEHVLKNNFHNYPKGGVFHDRFEELLGDGIFNSDGELWKIQRKTASFEFASRVLRDFSFGVFKEYALKLADIVEDAQAPVDIQDLFMRMTLDTICSLGFGTQLGVLNPTLPRNDFAMAFDKCNEIVAYRFADPFWKIKRFLKIGHERSLPKNLKTVNDFAYNIIRKRRIQLQQNYDLGSKQNLLSRFMLLDQNFSDKSLRDVILNFVIAGRDTTASTLTYFVYMIASHPQFAKKIYDELCEFERAASLDSHPHFKEPNIRSMSRFMDLLTHESLSKLVYLHAAVTETVRLFPAVPMNVKEVVKDDMLPSGTYVKRGYLVAYAPYGMGRMKALWGCDASDFRPERWNQNGVWDFNVSPFKFTAFQAGPRICLGKDSAYLQMKVTAALLCRFFEFQIVPGQVLQYKVMATISLKNGIKITTLKRN